MTSPQPLDSGQDRKPVPDPTALTTAALESEILHLRELIESRLNNMDKAVIAALDTAQRAVIALEADTTRRIDAVKEVTDARFVTYRTLLDSGAEKVAVALEAENKARDAAFASSKEAITKAETFNEKRFDLLSKAIDELKQGATLSAGKGAGFNAGWAYLLGALGAVAAVVSIIIATR